MLFEAFSFSGLRLRNRMVRSATYMKLADASGFVTDEMVSLYEELASGGVGLIITGCTLVHPSGRFLERMLSLHTQRHAESLKRLTDAVHEKGGVIAVQLAHGGRQCPSILLGGLDSLAPSAVHDPSTRTTPRAMTDEEIWQMVEAFGDAAWRARYAGFDALELHAAHGYLISSFLSPHTNRRDDYWGGDEERRFHFIEEVFKAVKSAAGADFPVLIKINCDDLLPGGITTSESARVASRLEELGLDAVEISGGMGESETRTIRPGIDSPAKEAYFRGAGRIFKDALGIPVIVTGGMRSVAVMEDVLQKGEADLIGMSRPLIREPHLPELMRDGREAADCISCNKCVRFSRMRNIRCKNVNDDSSPGTSGQPEPDEQSETDD